MTEEIDSCERFLLSLDDVFSYKGESSVLVRMSKDYERLVFELETVGIDQPKKKLSTLELYTKVNLLVERNKRESDALK